MPQYAAILRSRNPLHSQIPGATLILLKQFCTIITACDVLWEPGWLPNSSSRSL